MIFAFSKKNMQKSKKLLKKVLTKGEESGIICKRSDERRKKNTAEAERTSPEKSFLKTFKKGIDKREEMWYNNEVAAKTGTLIFEN